MKAVVGGRESEWSDEAELTRKKGAKADTCGPSASGQGTEKVVEYEEEEEREEVERC